MTAREPAFPLQIAKPCPKTWSELEGGEGQRFCSACSLHVHDATALTRDEARALVTNARERVCMRMRLDASGAPIFRADPTRTRPAARLMRWALTAAAGVLAACHGSVTPSAPADPSIGNDPLPGTGTEHTTEILGGIEDPTATEIMGDVAVPPPPEILGEAMVVPDPAPTPPADGADGR